jgi:hypothetical protein
VVTIADGRATAGGIPAEIHETYKERSRSCGDSTLRIRHLQTQEESIKESGMFVYRLELTLHESFFASRELMSYFRPNPC